MRALLLHFLLIVAAAPSGCTVTRRNLEHLSADAIQVLAILDRFDPGDRSRLPFVRIDSGRSSGPWFDDYSWSDYGFLERVTSDHFEVRLLHLMRESYRTDLDRGLALPPSTSSADFGAFVRGILRYETEGSFPYVYPDTIFAHRVLDAILARDCLGRGMDAEAEALFQKAIGDNPEWFRYALAKGLNDLLILRFRDPSLSRVELLAHHREWMEFFPGGEDWGRVEERTEMLERMVEEDRTNVKVATKTANPEDLVRALRDEVTPIRNHFFGSDHLDSFLPRSDGPARQLMALGLKAVPALIGALEDDRFTRCVYEETRHGGGFEVVTIGWMANDILVNISGLVYSGDKESWSGWLKDVRARGEEAVLAEAVLRREDGRVGSARLLLERWPQRVGFLIGENQKDPKRKPFDCLLLANTERPEALSYLRSEVENGVATHDRVEAASALWTRGDRMGLDWAAADLRQEKDTTARVELASFLFVSRDAPSLLAVSREMANREELGKAALGYRDFKYYRRKWAALPNEGFTPAFGFVWIPLLEDRVPLEVSDPSHRPGWRTCDKTAEAASTLWPDRFRFNVAATSTLRDRHVMRIRNLFASMLELPVLPEAEASHSNERKNVAEADLETSDEESHRSPDLRERVETLKDRPLNGTSAIQILRDLIANRETTLPLEISATLDRTQDGRGPSFWLKYGSESNASRGTSLLAVTATRDGKPVIGLNASFPGPYRWPSEFDQLEKFITTCASAPKDSTFRVHMRCFIPAEQ